MKHRVSSTPCLLLLAIGLLCLPMRVALGAPSDLPAGVPPLVGSSRYEKEVDADRYPDAPAPATPPLLRWDLSEARAWVYAYQQDSVSESLLSLPAMGPTGVQEQPPRNVQARGTLVVRSQGNASASLSLDLAIRVESPGRPPQNLAPKPLTVEGLQEDGRVRADGAGAGNPAVRLLFPLPTRPLRVGESETFQRELPVEIMNQKLTARGVSRLLLDRYVQIGSRPCARLVASLDVLRLEVPADVQGSYRHLDRARAVYYFDTKECVFVSGRVSTVSSSRGVGPPSEAQAGWPAEMRRPTFHYSADSDTLVTLKLDADRTRAANRPSR